MPKSKTVFIALLMCAFSLLFCTGNGLAYGNDPVTWEKGNSLGVTASYFSGGDVEYVYGMDNDVCLLKYSGEPSPEIPDYIPPDGWPTDGSFTVSNIGDSYQANLDIQATYTSRLMDPYDYRSIPGTTTPTFHDFSGQRLGGILSGVRSQNLGAAEGVDFVLIQGGTNDINLDRGLSLDELVDRMIGDIQSIIDEVLSGVTDMNNRPAIIVSAIPPMLDPALTDKAQAFTERLVTDLDKVDIITTANFWELYDSGTDTANADYMKDNIHTNADGSYRVAENWFKAIDALYNPDRITYDPYIYAGNWYYNRGASIAGEI